MVRVATDVQGVEHSEGEEAWSEGSRPAGRLVVGRGAAVGVEAVV